MACGCPKKTGSWTHRSSGAMQSRLVSLPSSVFHMLFNLPQLLHLQIPSFMQQPEMPTSFPWGSLHPWCAREAWSPPGSWFSSGSRTTRGPWGTWWAWLVAIGVVIIWNLIQHLIESVHLTYKEK